MIAETYFRAIQNQLGSHSMHEAAVAEAKLSLRDELITSVHYMMCKRNGAEQGFVVTPSDAYHKYEIEALPDEPLLVGDEIECMNEHWIVVKTRVASPFQTIGLMWLCNHKFRWQNHTPEIIERWGVLDSGVYSTTRDGNGDLMTPDKQFKIYFPKDADTAKLFIDKRLAVEVINDGSGSEILNVYRITGYDSVSVSYGRGGHLLVLNARSDDYVPNRDSVEELICDYIPAQPTPDIQTGTITGPAQIRAGKTRTYSADFTVSVWSLSPEIGGAALTASGDTATLAVDLDDDLVGEIMTIRADGTNAEDAAVYATLDVEVIA